MQQFLPKICFSRFTPLKREKKCKKQLAIYSFRILAIIDSNRFWSSNVNIALTTTTGISLSILTSHGVRENNHFYIRRLYKSLRHISEGKTLMILKFAKFFMDSLTSIIPTYQPLLYKRSLLWFVVVFLDCLCKIKCQKIQPSSSVNGGKP